MDPNRRLFLNFGGNHDKNQPYNDRVYPTTPSTFPQQIYDRPQGQQNYGRQQQGPPMHGMHDEKNYLAATGTSGGTSSVAGAASSRNTPGGVPPVTGGYFGTASYQPQYQQQQQQQQQLSQQPQASQFQQYVPNYQAQQSAYQMNPWGYGTGDGANGLVQQFAHQNLGPASRPAPLANRQTSPGQGMSPHGVATPGQGGITSHGAAAQFMSQTSDSSVLPERKPGCVSGLVCQRATVCSEWGNNFFKQNVKRARDRNERQTRYEKYIADPNVSTTKKEAARQHMCQGEADYLRFLRTKERPENFESIKIIGKGAFGEVKLVRKRKDGRVYALKSLVKAEMFKKDQLAHVRAERDILAESESPWVVKLFTTYQDANFLYMLMEFLPGGDLMTMLIKYEIFSEDITRFYMAEIILAIEAVHQLGFVHRDIKPDNILLDKDGHIKLTDFGLSTGFHTLHDNSYYQKLLSGKSNKSRDRNSVSLDQINLTVSNRPAVNTWRKSRRVMAYSTVGTPDYIAPEIFSGNGYSFSCDWWSLGTIMFECLVGWPPFCADDPHDTYRKIVNWRHTLYFPSDIQLGAEAEHLIRSLICESSDRLGTNGAQEIKRHAFFKGVVFEHLRKIEAPFKPKLKSNIDVTYFPTDEIDQTDHAAALRASNPIEAEDTPELVIPFMGYTFKRFNAFRGSS